MASPDLEQIRAALATVNDPEIKRPITELNMVDHVSAGDDGRVSVRVLLTVAGCPLKDTINRDVNAALTKVPGVTGVDLEMGVMTPEQRGSVALIADLLPDPSAVNSASGARAIRLRVIDTGIGIHRRDFDKLFQPFRQIDSGLARQHEGTGLGLAICRRLAGLLGGQIEADSQWGVGSTFTFTLPLVPPARA